MEDDECPTNAESFLKRKNSKDGIQEFTDIIGGCGKWQRKIFFITFFFGISQVWNHLGITFLAFPVDHWCAKTNRSNWTLQLEKDQIFANGTSEEHSDRQCDMYVFNVTVDGYFITTNETEPCKNFEYSTEYYSIVQEWNIVCGKTWLLSVSQSVYMFGFFIAVLLTGHVSDMYGRRPAIMLNLSVLLISSFATAFSTSFTMFTILRSFVALGQAGLDLAIQVMLTEIFGPSCRGIYVLLPLFSYITGYIILPVIAWLLSDWFYLQLVFALPSVYYMSLYWMIPESPRWLLSKGYIEKAFSVMSIAAKENSVHVPNMKEMLEKLSYREKKKKETDKKITVLDLLRTPNLRLKTLCLFFVWITLCFSYYGLCLYSNHLYGNKFQNFFFAGLTEIPATVCSILTTNRYGRKKPLFWGLLIGGLSCLGSTVIPRGYEGVKTGLTLFGRMFVSGAFGIIFLFSAEIFPTVARNLGIGMCSMVARIGSALSPFMVDLGQATDPSVPLILFGLMSIVSSFLLLKLPETHNQSVPETIEEAEIPLEKKPVKELNAIELS